MSGHYSLMAMTSCLKQDPLMTGKKGEGRKGDYSLCGDKFGGVETEEG